MVRVTLLLVLVLALWAAEAKRKKKPKPGESEDTTDMEGLRQKVSDLERRLGTLEAGGSVAASGACPSEKVHLHFHGDAEEMEDHGSPDDTYVHIKLDVDDHDGYHDFHKAHHMDDKYSAHCQMKAVESADVEGYLHFTQYPRDKTVNITAHMSEFPEANAVHALHVHEYGDVSEGCSSLGRHFDPFDKDADVGDLGTVTTDSDKTVTHTFENVRLSLFGADSIIGRSVIIHDKDGARMACCLIGWGKESPVHSHEGHGHDDDHDHDHDHDHEH